MGIWRVSLPHARGGVSASNRFFEGSKTSSPRPWGCFFRLSFYRYTAGVFPTPVGVFLRQTNILIDDAKSSPRPWGCFLHQKGFFRFVRVFPTPVGVFLLVDSLPRFLARLPHARGGVSRARTKARKREKSSPRPWGCFCRNFKALFHNPVFPTPVGVFPVGI